MQRQRLELLPVQFPEYVDFVMPFGTRSRIAASNQMIAFVNPKSILVFSFQTYFEDNPQDLSRLRHDKALHSVKIKSHLANVPEYIIPESLKQFAGIAETSKQHKKSVKRSSSQRVSELCFYFRFGISPIVI